MRCTEIEKARRAKSRKIRAMADKLKIVTGLEYCECYDSDGILVVVRNNDHTFLEFRRVFTGTPEESLAFLKNILKWHKKCPGLFK